MKLNKILVIAWAFLAPYQLEAGTTLAAKANGVKVLSEPKNDASEIAALKQGDTVEGIERQGMYWKVKTKQGKQGFISFSKVSRQADGESNSLAKAIRDAAKDSRDVDGVKGTRSRSAVMGVRGLDTSEETASAGSVKPNLRMVYSMEDRIPTNEQVAQLGNLVQQEINAKLQN
jgi:hypothetical protein